MRPYFPDNELPHWWNFEYEPGKVDAMNTHNRPTELNAREAAARYLGHTDFTVRRYPTGLCHYVFEVTPSNAPKIVVRMGHDDTRKHLHGSVFWDSQLNPLNLPTARILVHNLTEVFPYTILEHLPGTDLGEAFTSLSSNVRGKVAREVARIQDSVALLPRAEGFGYGFSYSDERMQPTWKSFLQTQLDRAREWTRSAGVAPESHVDRVTQAVRELDGYLADVEPVPFLHDTTTKNVLVNEAGLVGIVDIDDLCFGDRLYVLSLTYMATLSAKLPSDYIESWSDAWKLTDTQRQVTKAYTAINCVGFIGEIGQRFNQEEASVDFGRLQYLEGILDGLLG